VIEGLTTMMENSACFGEVLNLGSDLEITINDLAQKAIELTNSEFALLATFLRAPRIILSRDQLLEGSRMHADIFDRSIDVQILRLRRKLEPNPNEPRLIVTRRGAGYLLDSEVETVR